MARRGRKTSNYGKKKAPPFKRGGARRTSLPNAPKRGKKSSRKASK